MRVSARRPEAGAGGVPGSAGSGEVAVVGGVGGWRLGVSAPPELAVEFAAGIERQRGQCDVGNARRGDKRSHEEEDQKQLINYQTLSSICRSSICRHPTDIPAKEKKKKKRRCFSRSGVWTAAERTLVVGDDDWLLMATMAAGVWAAGAVMLLAG